MPPIRTESCALSDVLSYTARVAPGLLLVGGCYVLARADRDPWLRVVALILGFVLLRDAMTPLGFWSFGATEHGVPWLRFTDDAGVLLLFAVVSLGLVAGVTHLDPGLRALVRWGRPNPATVGVGIGGGVLVTAPVLLLSPLSPLSERGGAVAPVLLPALLFLALAGNLAEEVLFRGFAQGRMEQAMGAVRAAWLSGLLFAACHVFLTATVTDVGWPLLLFTLYEGLVCAFVRMRHGVIAAALTHGLAVFLLTSGLV